MGAADMNAGWQQQHMQQLDVKLLCADGCVLQDMTQIEAELAAATQEVQAATAAHPLAGRQQLNLQLTQMQKQLASSTTLDGSLRAIGTAYAALLAMSHREGLAVATRFLSEASSTAGSTNATAATARGAATSKVLKLGDCSMKRLRNGDVYKVGRQASVSQGSTVVAVAAPAAAAVCWLSLSPGCPMLWRIAQAHTALRRTTQDKLCCDDSDALVCCRVATRAHARMEAAPIAL